MVDYMQCVCMVVYFVQLLDGKIVIEFGYFKWIGNDENLVYVYCMCVLCDVVLIGGGILACDCFWLMVWYVVGEYFVCVVVGWLDVDYDFLLQACDQFIFVYGVVDVCVDVLVDYI